MSKDKDHIRMVEQAARGKNNLPPFVNQTRDTSLSILIYCLDELFSSCDDLFFDLSSRAISNSEQNLYFESMRDLRVKKHGVINRYKQNIERCFLKLADSDSALANNPNRGDASYESLSVVHNDDLEQEVAISGMISKARVNNQEALYQLTTRLDYLINSAHITENNNPLDPHQLCTQFADACELLEIGIKARIIIFKQFDRHVVGRFSNLYAAVNNLLINAGVMPKISHGIKKSTSAQSPEVPITEESAIPLAQELSGQSYDFLEISNLLAAIRRNIGLNNLPNYYSYTAHPGPAMPETELIKLLSQIQLSQIRDSLGSHSEHKLHEVINGLLSQRNPAEPQALKQPDEDVINLVSMFFDFVLDDTALPLSTQALISRLQIPILKVAIRNKNFFSSGKHPARRLVNLIASASIGCDGDEAKDRLHKKVSQVVHHINEHFVDDESIFENQLSLLQEFVEREQRNASLVEKRTSQALEGQARTRLAKDRAQNVLLEKLEKKSLPDTIMSFLTEQWLHVLVLTFLKEGDESAHWLDTVQLIDDLGWACQYHQDTRSKDRLARLVPELLKKIDAGLSNVVESDDTFREQMALVRQALANAQSEEIARRSMSAAEACALGHTPGSGSRSWQEMTAVERQQAKYKALTYEFIKKAEEIPIGTWFTYDDNESGSTLRCKLASRISESDSYIFVNRYGFKALEKPRKEFAYDMQKSVARPLEAGLLVDRAMSKIIGNLSQFSSTLKQQS